MRNRTIRRHGGTLFEVTIAITLLSVLLVPAVRLTSGAMTRQRRFETHDALLYHAENRVEEARARAHAGRPIRNRVFDEVDPDFNRVRTRVVTINGVTNVTAGPPLPDHFVLIVESWNEQNLDRTRNNDEPYVRLQTIVPR